MLIIPDFSSNQGFLATINDDWLNNMNDIDIFGTDVMNFNARYGILLLLFSILFAIVSRL